MPNITLYIPQYLDDYLSLEKNKSGLVSQLLANYYAGKPKPITGLGMNKAKEKEFERLKQAFPPIKATVGNVPLETALVTPVTLTPTLPNSQTIVPPEYTA